jgi:hypothetical protein
MFLQHGRGIGIYRASPAFGKEAPSILVGVAARGEGTIRVCRNSSGVSARFFPESIVFEKAGNAAQANDGNGNFFHFNSLND